MFPRASAESETLGLGQGRGQSNISGKVRRQDQQEILSNVIFQTFR